MQKKKEIVVFFGRVNPITRSHMSCFLRVYHDAQEMKCDHKIYLSSTHEIGSPTRKASYNNPLTSATKIFFCKKAVERYNAIQSERHYGRTKYKPVKIKFVIAREKTKTNTPFTMAETLAKKYETIHIVAGEERAPMIASLQKHMKDTCIINHIIMTPIDIVLHSGDVISPRASMLRKEIYSLRFDKAEEMMPEIMTTDDKLALYYSVLTESGCINTTATPALHEYYKVK